MEKQFYIGIDNGAAPFNEFMEIAEAELDGRLMVFHIKKKWREYDEGTKYDGEELLFVDLDSELQKLFNL